MIHRAAALADLFHPLCGQPGLLLRVVDPVPGDGFLDNLFGGHEAVRKRELRSKREARSALCPSVAAMPKQVSGLGGWRLR